MRTPSRSTRRAWLMKLGGLGPLVPLGQLGAALGLGVMPAQAQSAQTAGAFAPPADPVRRGRPLVFPRDHGAHPASRIEWWYVTGWLRDSSAAAPASPSSSKRGLLGFQITFFRSRTGLAEDLSGRLAPRQLLFAHAALTDLDAATHQHDARLGRWNGLDSSTPRTEPPRAGPSAPAGPSRPGPEIVAPARVRAAMHDADVAVHGWRLHRQDGPARWLADIAARGFTLTLEMGRTQPLLLQGQAGFSRKGPQEAQASHYLSEPQLAVTGQLRRSGRTQPVQGRAWLDQEWSDELLHPEAVGWDWIGMNLDDGSALTAFRLRRADGSALWAGGSFRRAGQAQAQDFPADTVRFEPGRRWRSPTSGGDYPVAWTVHTPTGRFGVQALLDAQELDSRSSTGTVYWEGLSELQSDAGQRIGLGYLEMTGYAGRLVL